MALFTNSSEGADQSPINTEELQNQAAIIAEQANQFEKDTEIYLQKTDEMQADIINSIQKLETEISEIEIEAEKEVDELLIRAAEMVASTPDAELDAIDAEIEAL